MAWGQVFFWSCSERDLALIANEAAGPRGEAGEAAEHRAIPQAAQAQAVAVLRNSGHGENIRVCMG